ncbi:MAG: MFS transporter [Candidatus Helarchaeota archaeon]
MSDEGLSFQEKQFLGVSINVILFGFVSLFTDFSSDLVTSVLPLFLLSIGANATILGLISGVSEATGNILKGVSGYLSDKIRNRKALVFAGYGISNIAKPMIGLFPNWLTTLGLKFTDRIGKGLRTSPRDAIIADSGGKTGGSFGLHRAMDTTGAVLGPLVAFFLIFYFFFLTRNLTLTYAGVIIFSIIPGLIALVFILVARDPKREKERFKPEEQAPIKKELIYLIVVMAIAEFASIDLAFFIVRAQDFIMAPFIPLIVALSNLVYVFFAIFAGRLSDKIGRKPTILMGLGILLLTSIGMAIPYPPMLFTVPLIVIFFVFFGMYHGFVDPVARAFVSDIMGKNKKGRGYGLYYLVIGLVTLPESIIFGFIYDHAFPPFGYVFAFGYASVILSICIVIFAIKKFN